MVSYSTLQTLVIVARPVKRSVITLGGGAPQWTDHAKPIKIWDPGGPNVSGLLEKKNPDTCAPIVRW